MKQSLNKKIIPSVLLIELLFHFIRQVAQYYQNRGQFIVFMMCCLLIEIAYEISCLFGKQICKNFIQLLIIMLDVILIQIEQIFFEFQDLNQNYVFLIIMFFYSKQFGYDEFKVQKIAKLFYCILFAIIICSFSFNYSNNYNDILTQNITSLINQKLNISLSSLLLLFLIKYNNDEHQLRRSTSTQLQIQSSRKIIQPSHQDDLKYDTKRSSVNEMSEMITERRMTRNDYLMLQVFDPTILMDILQEGVIIIKASKSTENNNFIFTVDFQNLMCRNMFNKSNEELILLFQEMKSEVLKQESPIVPRSSVLSVQSYGQMYIKSMKRSSKINTAQYFFQELKSSSHPSNSPKPRAQTVTLTTVYKSIVEVWQSRRGKFEINGKVEAMVIEANYDDNQCKRQIEFMITIGGENSILIVARDVLYRKNIKDLLEVNQSKSKTLSYVSHELRSPLNIILNILENTKKDVVNNSNIYQNICIVIENANHMLNLSNDLLDLAQIKNDSFTLNLKSIDIVELGFECLKMFKLQATQKGILLKVQANKTPLYIQTDKKRLKQILINLIANSMKFTQQGQIIIKITENKGLVEIGVQDTGIGISEQDQMQLFRAFGKIKDGLHQKLNEQGVGLGLLISNKIAQQLSYDHTGLKIISSNFNNMGSYFYMTLKMNEKHAKINLKQLSAIEVGQQSPANFDQINQVFEWPHQISFAEGTNICSIDQKKQCCQTCNHILIVDDNAFNQTILEMQIKQFTTSQIDKANNGKEAIDKVQQKHCCEYCKGYSAIFMDIEMPVMNGIQASEIILKNDDNKKIKIFIVSGYDNESEKQYCRQIGVYNYIVKPFSKDKIQEIIIENSL